jgi:hypothetical protein
LVHVRGARIPGAQSRSTGTGRAFRGVWLAMALVGASALLAAQGPVEPSSRECSGINLIQSATVGQYVFKAYKDRVNGDGCLEVHEIRRQGKIIGKLIPKVVFRRTLEGMGEFTLGQNEGPNTGIPKIENGADITGRGRADMIVTNRSGGAGCCSVHYVFEVEPTLWLLARIDDGDGDSAHFVDLDGNHHYYYVGNDWTFSYWNSSFANSPAPTVVLRFVDDKKAPGYHLAMDKMQRPAPTTAQWNKAIREAGDAFGSNGGFGDGVGSALWSNMLNLIYTGHSDLAWKLTAQAWPSQRPGQDTFISSFCSQLKTSTYWPDLEPTLQETPPACIAAKPAPR